MSRRRGPRRQQSKRKSCPLCTAHGLRHCPTSKGTHGPFVTWLPVPDRRLSPNARVHWRTRAPLVLKARQGACVAACKILGVRAPQWHEVTARATFHFPDRRRRDTDNLAALLKPVWDGLVDAGLLIDDDRITHLPVEIVHEKGCVPVVKIEVWTEVEKSA